MNDRSGDGTGSFEVKIQVQNTRLCHEIANEKNVKCVHIIKCAKVRALFPDNKVRFARAEQLCLQGGTVLRR